MGASCISGGKKVYICRHQLSADSTKFSAPYWGTVILYPDSKTVDINLTCRVESIGSLDSSFGYFTLDTIKTQCNIKNLYIPNNSDYVVSSVIPFGSQQGMTDDMLMGRTGLTLAFEYKNVSKFSLARTYKQSEGNTFAVGSWPMNMENLIVVGRCFAIDIRGLQYD